MKFYMNVGSDGNISGFYLDTINKVIPESAIPITQEQYEQIYKEPYKFIVNNGSIRAKTQEEIDAENDNLPPAPKSPDQVRIDQLTLQSGDLLFRLAQAQIELNNNKSQTAMMLFQLATIQGGI